VVLTDSTVAVNFAKAGAVGILIEYLADRVLVCRDVLEELRRIIAVHPSLASFVKPVDADEEARIAPLSLAGLQKVDDLARALRLPDDHPRKHIGECATVVAAQEMTARGIVPFVCMDDRDGKQLARQARLTFGDSPELVIEMVLQGAIRDSVGAQIWRRGLFPEQRSAWPGFQKRLG